MNSLSQNVQLYVLEAHLDVHLYIVHDDIPHFDWTITSFY